MQDDHYNLNTEEVEPAEINNFDFNEIESAILSSSVESDKNIPHFTMYECSIISYDMKRFIRWLFPRMNFFKDNPFFN